MKTRSLVAILGVLVAIVSAVACVRNYTLTETEISSWKAIAEISLEPQDIYDYLGQVKNGLERWGMTSGNATTLDAYRADTDMALINRALDQQIAQAKALAEMDRSSAAYHTGMDNLQRSIRGLKLHASDYYANRQGTLLAVIVFLGLLTALVAKSTGTYTQKEISATGATGY